MHRTIQIAQEIINDRLVLDRRDYWPKVTIVTPSFNQGQYLEETIQSVLTQDYPNIEYIIIDGGSSDESVSIIKKHESRLAFWVSERDKGQSDAINKGFLKASGELYGWLNSDDLLYPDSITKIVKLFQDDASLEMAYGDVEFGLSKDTISKIIIGEKLSFSEMLKTLQVPIPQQGCLWKSSVFEKIGALDVRWQVVLDREFFLRVAEACEIKYVPGVLGLFRDHLLSKSSSQKSRWLKELPAMYLELFLNRKLDENIISLKAETMGSVFLVCSSIALQDKKLITAFYFIIKAVLWDPIFFTRTLTRKKITRILDAKRSASRNAD